MEKEDQENQGTKKRTILILLIFVSVFLIYYSVMLFLSPGRKYEELKSEFGYKQDEKKPVNDSIFSDSVYLDLFKKKSFYQSRVTMAETDSIYLTLNLADSIIKLEISGVEVHTVKASKIKVSTLIMEGDDYVISSFLSRPLTVIHDYSTIEKEPLMIKMAPKDTSEYEPDIMPDTADYEPVNFIMQLDHGIRIYVLQDEKQKSGDGLNRFMFDLRFRFKDLMESLKSICTFKVPEYHPFIKIRLPRDDAKIIYRALPEEGQIGVTV